jgi:hypothetical protein
MASLSIKQVRGRNQILEGEKASTNALLGIVSNVAPQKRLESASQPGSIIASLAMRENPPKSPGGFSCSINGDH